jgi:hypothetical protein
MTRQELLARISIDPNIVAALRTLVAGLLRNGVNRKLWVVQRKRIREYSPPEQ